ncbi:MAG: methionyl-tRNA formyltransferase [Bryobacterales bacterium]|nr:methionyl-tRNA formyltransferase [Bryobacterales bacterium]
MRLIFMGTPAFAVPSLQAIVKAGHTVSHVYTQPDRPAGRGGKMRESAVKLAARELDIRVEQPARIRAPEVIAQLTSEAPDAIVVVGYGQIIPRAILDIPRFGIINVHGSLLPKYRGAAPIQWAVANGETVTGVTTMLINEGLDTGDMLLREKSPIGPDETALSVAARLADIGADLLVRTLDGVATNAIQPEPQNNADATLAPILSRADGLVDWNRPASVIYNRYRGFQPWPGAWTLFRGTRFQLKELVPAPDKVTAGGEMPGTLIAERKRLYVVADDREALELRGVQLEGKSSVSAEAFINGAQLRGGERLGT